MSATALLVVLVGITYVGIAALLSSGQPWRCHCPESRCEFDHARAQWDCSDCGRVWLHEWAHGAKTVHEAFVHRVPMHLEHDEVPWGRAGRRLVPRGEQVRRYRGLPTRLRRAAGYLAQGARYAWREL